MSPTKYAIAICDDEKYWQNQILNCCKLLDNDINFNFNTIYFHLAKMYLNTRAILIFYY